MEVSGILAKKIRRPLLLFSVFFTLSRPHFVASSSNTTDGVEDIQSQALEQYQFADGMRTRKFYDLAAVEYERVIKNYPSFEYLPEAHFYLAECFRLNHQNAKAIDVFNTLLDRYPNHSLATQAVVNLASIFIQAEKLVQAKEILLETLERRNPNQKIREAVYYFLGEVYRKEKLLDKAVEYLTKVASKNIDPSYQYRAYALLNLGFVYRNLENKIEAFKCFERLSNDSATPPSIKEEALFQLAEVANSNEEYTKAIEYYAVVLSNYPKGKFVQQAVVNKCWALLRLKKYQIALEFLDSYSLNNTLINSEMLYLHALCLKLLDQIEPALEAYQGLIQKFPDTKFRVYAENDSTECLYQLKRYDQCLNSVDEFLSRHSKHELTSEVWAFKGRCLLALGQTSEATTAIEQALERYGERWKYAEEMLLTLANTYRETDQFKEAALTYKRLSDLDEMDLKAKLLMLAAECESLANDKKMAIQHYTLLIDNYPKAPETPLALLYLAELKNSEEKYPEAIGYLDRYLSSYPNHDYFAKALYLRGALQYYSGDYSDAIADLRRCLDYPDFEEKDFAQLFFAYALWEQGEEQVSLENLAQLLKRKSSVFEENLIPELLSEMGDRYLALNDFAAAEMCFTLIKDRPDPILKLLGRLGLGKLEYHRQNFDKAVEILYGLKSKTLQYPELRGTSLAYLGDALRLSEKLDEAFVVFKEASNLVYDDSKAKALVRLGIARIYFENGEYDDALRYAISVYVLYDDPILTPEAMLIAIKTLILQKRKNEAKSTYEELEQRYPLALAAFKSKEENKALFDQF